MSQPAEGDIRKGGSDESDSDEDILDALMILTLAGLILAKDQLRRSIAASGVTQSAMLVGEKYTQEVLAGDSGWARKVLRMEQAGVRCRSAFRPLTDRRGIP